MKSDLDIEQFTLNSQGPFPAHQFHFLCRQYGLSLLELRRLYNDVDRLEKKKDHLVDARDDPEKGFFVENEIAECDIQIDNLKLSIANKTAMCTRFEQCRKKLVENNGKEFTNAQMQAEEPDYWQYTILHMLRNYRRQAASGIPEGLWKNIEMLQEEPLLDQNNKLTFNESLPAQPQQITKQEIVG